MAKNTGKKYEQFVESIYQALTKDERFTTVERDVKLEGRDGPRQIDVLLRSEVANLNLLTVIECRDYNKRLSIEHLDGLHSKLQDVNASKGVLVSRKGFSSTAFKKARRVGITLCQASDAKTVLKEIKSEVSIKVSNVSINFRGDFNFHAYKGGASFSVPDVLKEMGVFDEIHRKMINGGIKIPPADPTIQLDSSSSDVILPHNIRDSRGNKIARFDGFNIQLMIDIDHYYGHLSEIPDLTSMHQHDKDSTTFIFKEEDYPNIIPSLTKFKSEKDIPQNYRLTFNLLDFKYRPFMKESRVKNPKQVIKVKHPKK